MYELREAATQWITPDEYNLLRNRSKPLTEAESAEEAIILGVLLGSLPLNATLLRAYRWSQTLLRAYRSRQVIGPQNVASYKFRPDTEWLIVKDTWWTYKYVPYLGVVLRGVEILLGPTLLTTMEVIQQYHCGRFCIGSDIPRKELADYIAWHLDSRNYPSELV